ncbi:bifunctional phosphopantothenoylcysteine decarboxylase/phosphopantothenate--cysteine ligase CoaBC [Legionella taurinensis]|uniref:Coenzyme A biosynthesis bifunctional protein CoaBC n=1 Tax=Legionella taurinensis TaxID=70611 RepID=A0A3A5L2D4_9GAMM|nr:bifunctional phosphopantothenoylcysteine decarboxylase/phosphopantothenate--cysteine ligase CoaBC [Legionella taurinensis]MDX1838585.1 bifunctional phosphopantothenoylcysteine decarboxylase/phosphopantothenate--cysteine ligase CoaBC [Legionella taurinensis]PUT39028.1 bifunctional phosphopantothenoylcysteine decarboxylase/phosphopantothenate--cysteine ligase CoaBC [Legionella taurinensis]PUT41115.1 bifunctional phosphopantothenoylcysteine decarboxylase/phosphopantothenate--cysteine ligase CoaB
MQDFAGKNIVLGICGGIAAYKSAYLIRELTRLGADVRVVMTQSAQQFITPLTLQALSGHEVRTELFDSQAERAMGHIELARWADYLLIAPASANFLAKMAHGLADDLLSTLCLVAENPVIVCPAMNRSMWQHPATRDNCQTLRNRGVIFVGPDEGLQACGEEGPGRLSDVEAILTGLRLHAVSGLLTGRTVMITAGPTWEAIDPVRMITNRSSGKMGYALAAAAQRAGAEVLLISGPSALPVPPGVTAYRVESARDMRKAVMGALKPGMIFIGCAAVADYGIDQPSSEKIKKQQAESLSLTLTKNPDILADVASSGKAAYVVGFAAETTKVVEHARQKLKAKKLDMIIANQVGGNKGFEQDGNEVIVITSQEERTLAFQHKTRIAGEIIAILAATLQNGSLTKARN